MAKRRTHTQKYFIDERLIVNISDPKLLVLKYTFLYMVRESEDVYTPLGTVMARKNYW